jgi:flagellar biosynthesis GTPase FlhF
VRPQYHSLSSLSQAKKPRVEIAPTSDLKTTQLFVLSSRKHRDAIKSTLQRAKAERDRANAAFVSAQHWLKDANDNVEAIERELKEAQEEYSEAKRLSSQEMAEIAVDESEDEDQPKKRSRKSDGISKYKKAPLITELLMDMAKSGMLVDGKKLHEVDIIDVGHRDKSKFINAMVLVEELWTEEEVRFGFYRVCRVLDYCTFNCWANYFSTFILSIGTIPPITTL